jgi:hypothetical protein
MNFAYIFPENYAHLFRNAPYHLALMQCLKENWALALQMHRISLEGKYIILDNGAYEKRAATLEDIADMQRQIQAAEIVLPDILMDTEGTLEVAGHSYHWLQYLGLHADPSFMVVPQGTSPIRWFECLRSLLANLGPKLKCIGIPVLCDAWPKGRTQLVETARQILTVEGRSDIQVHLLGWNGSLSLLRAFQDMAPECSIRGIDSAKPIYYAMAGIAIDNVPQQRPKRPESYFRAFGPDPGILKYLHHNIEVINSICKSS